MKKLTLLSILVVLSLVLAACGNAGSGNGTVQPGAEGTFAPGMGTDVGGAEGTLQVPVTGDEATATLEAPVATTEVVTTEPVVTEDAMATSTPAAGGAEVGVPVTGEGLTDANINLLSELLDVAVVTDACEVFGEVDGVLVNRSGDIVYVEVDPEDDAGLLEDYALLPYGALEVNQNIVDDMGTGVQATQPADSGAATQPAGDAAGTATVDGAAGACDVFDIGDAVRLTVDTAALAGMPAVGVDDDDLSGVISGQDWDAELRSFWSEQGVTVVDTGEGFAVEPNMSSTEAPAGTETADPGMESTAGAGQAGQIGGLVEIDDLGELDLLGAGDEAIGDIHDFIVDPAAGQITHAILSVGGFLGIGERYVPVPFNALNWTVSDDGMYVIHVDTDQERLEAAPGFDSLDAFDVNEEGWDSELDSYWQPMDQ